MSKNQNQKYGRRICLAGRPPGLGVWGWSPHDLFIYFDFGVLGTKPLNLLKYNKNNNYNNIIYR